MPILKINIDGLSQADAGLRKFAARVLDLRPFWRLLGETLADDSQARWPLRRGSGKLRASLIWAGGRLGKGGMFLRPAHDRLAFGTAVFYARFHQHGAKHTPRRPLIHITADAHAELLASWLVARAQRAGLEVTG